MCMYIHNYSVKQCNLDAIIYNKITSIVNVISHGLVIAWKLMVHNSGDFCNSIIMIILHCPKTLNSKLFVLRGCVSLCSPSLYYI